MKEIWVVGSSIVVKAGDHAAIRPTGSHLGFDRVGCRFVWAGSSGMKWAAVVPTINMLVRYRRRIPSVLLIHCGGNDIGEAPNGALLYHMRFSLAIISRMLPKTSVVYSYILPRHDWRFSNNVEKMETTRKRVNRGMRSYLLKIGGYIIKHPDFDDKHIGLYQNDGVHLSFIGNDIFLNQIQGAKETFTISSNCLEYPVC